jgi:hypothetical protein
VVLSLAGAPLEEEHESSQVELQERKWVPGEILVSGLARGLDCMDSLQGKIPSRCCLLMLNRHRGRLSKMK